MNAAMAMRAIRSAGTCAAVTICALLLCAALAPASEAQTVKPKVPASTDPGGIAIALLGSGIDYTRPDIATRLARDGEGEIIGLDLIDGDNRPYASAAAPNAAEPRSGTALAELMLSAYARSRLVAVRVSAGDVAAYARAIAFVVRTPARIVALPFGHRPAQWNVLQQAARVAREVLFVVAGVTDDAAAPPGRALPDNVLVVASHAYAQAAPASVRRLVDVWVAPRGSKMFGAQPGSAPANAFEAVALAAAFAACTQHRDPASSGAEAKARLLALASPARDHPDIAIVDPQCLYGGRRL